MINIDDELDKVLESRIRQGYRCDCILGNPEPNLVKLNRRLHDEDCRLRKNIVKMGF
jgi:hypothetical protein